jgi:hypothetical protein
MVNHLLQTHRNINRNLITEQTQTSSRHQQYEQAEQTVQYPINRRVAVVWVKVGGALVPLVRFSSIHYLCKSSLSFFPPLLLVLQFLLLALTL